MHMKDEKKVLSGWILYAGNDSGYSRHYISLYQNACRRRKMTIQAGIYMPRQLSDGLSAFRIERSLSGRLPEHAVSDGLPEYTASGSLPEYSAADRLPDFVINRTRDYRLAQWLEDLGVCVFNPSFLTRIGNDKAEAYRYMEQKKIPVMPTLYGTQTPPRWYPAVVKSCAGHGGTEVELIHGEADWEQWKAWKEQKDRQYIVQQAASCLGKDLRVYVVGNQIRAAVMRTSETDFRSNYCLGGRVQLYPVSDSVKELTGRVMEGLRIGMAGIDFIFHNGQLVFNEIEDVAGARGLYSLSDYDIVDDYIGYIQEELQHVTKADGTADL